MVCSVLENLLVVKGDTISIAKDYIKNQDQDHDNDNDNAKEKEKDKIKDENAKEQSEQDRAERRRLCYPFPLVLETSPQQMIKSFSLLIDNFRAVLDTPCDLLKLLFGLVHRGASFFYLSTIAY